MGQVSTPRDSPSIILSAVDRLVASNADGGLNVLASHVILLGESAGQNLDLSNSIGLGFNALGAVGTGITDTANLDGSIAIGQSSQGSITTAGNLPVARANTTIGRNTLASASFASANVVIGDNALALNVPNTIQPTRRMVVIGADAAYNLDTTGNAVQTQQSVVIGYAAATLNAGDTSKGLFRSVIIGDSAAGAFLATGANGLSGVVVIGDGAGGGMDENGNGSLDAVIIGRDAGTGFASADCVAIGATSNCLGSNRAGQVAVGKAAVTQSVNAVAVGNTATVAATADNAVAIGASATVPANSAHSIFIGAGSSTLGTGSIIIGTGAGFGDNAANTHRLAIETNLFGVRRGVLYGDMTDGNLIVGLSTPGTNRDMSGTNTLKLLDGTVGADPVGGGKWFGTAGELNWRSSAAVSYLLTPHASRGTFTVATLPAAGLLAGQRAYVSDANAPAFGAAPAGGGAVFVPVFYNGAAWIVG